MNARLPSLNGLRAFEAAARHLSFTRAAAELNVTQTAVSHLIRRLEQQLGIRLFIRRNRALLLTAEAQAYLPAVRSAFDDLRRATEQLRRPEQGRVLTVTTLPSLAAKWLLPRLGDFQTRHPEIDLRLNASSQVMDLRREGIDVAVRYGHGVWPGHRADFLMTEDVFPVCSPKLLEAGPPLRKPADLARHTLLHVSSYRENWRMWLTAAGLPTLQPAHEVTFDIVVLALQAAADGLGVALGRTRFVERDLAAGRLVKPFDIALPADAGFYFVTPIETAEQPKIRAFRDWLMEAVRAPGPADDDEA